MIEYKDYNGIQLITYGIFIIRSYYLTLQNREQFMFMKNKNED